MLPNLEFLLSSSHQSLPLAQIRIEPGAFVLENFSSPQLIVGLLSGIMMAFAFHLSHYRDRESPLAKRSELPKDWSITAEKQMPS